MEAKVTSLEEKLATLEVSLHEMQNQNKNNQEKIISLLNSNKEKDGGDSSHNNGGKVRSMIAMGSYVRAKLMNVARAVERELEEGEETGHRKGGKSTGGPRGMSGFRQNKTHTASTGNWCDRTVSLSSQEIAYRRQKGLCFKCGGQYHPRHQCPDKNLRVMVLEDDSEDENKVRVLNDEDVETGVEELQLNVLTF
ncbi:unnamed protein product [Vicia faba]|uniref:Uncharacterized protein n=1 Tax=Vicia faba TaxID=3906 RepID=A0AAV0ZGX3_VICFA|nr:unnamed protein product [Vicia faba]